MVHAELNNGYTIGGPAVTMSKELRYAFEDLMKQAGITEEQMVACWLEFIADRMREIADRK